MDFKTFIENNTSFRFEYDREDPALTHVEFERIKQLAKAEEGFTVKQGRGIRCNGNAFIRIDTPRDGNRIVELIRGT